jgi:hypothetical protein
VGAAVGEDAVGGGFVEEDVEHASVEAGAGEGVGASEVGDEAMRGAVFFEEFEIGVEVGVGFVFYDKFIFFCDIHGFIELKIKH